ncbi:CoA pyrophosphatase [Gramella sp. AN32]|uniref:NUDIX hydrolase n=1 Tax=Christiangramia antarctica TaxID=2058158 RepID=A0ABW5XBY6_9FLAO|nr:CoA pyrophosphatase [Gramella sp. AN32]MCM4156581.1 coenzyme A pyrophosphatase [Gramella sp. AN32]
MKFEIFLKQISKLKKMPLPGVEAQAKLAPLMRLEELSNINMEELNPQEAGVMAVFYPNFNGDTFLVLILRKTYQGVHSNQVGFPGGRVEPGDRDLEATALRETQEEVGIPVEAIEVIKKMTRLYIPPSNFWVQPYVGILQKTPVLIAQDTEVEKILEVDLEDFLQEKNVVSHKLNTSYAQNIDVPAYLLNEQIVWGATAMMLAEIREMLAKI